MNLNGWTKSRRKICPDEQECKTLTHQMAGVSKRKMRRRKYILQVGGFSTERATKIWRVFCGADVVGKDATNFSRTNAWSCRQLRGRVGSFGACGKVVYAV
jgi:hypothetical protein